MYTLEQRTTDFFETIARMIYSHGIVTFFMLFTTCSMVFYSHGLFSQVVPAHLPDWQRNTATWLMALGWESATLMAICNPKHVNGFVAVLISFASGFIVLFFFEAFDLSQEPITLVKRWFIGTLAGTINAVFARLFHAKYMEVTRDRKIAQHADELAQRDATIAQTAAELAQARAALAQRDAADRQRAAELAQRDAELAQIGAKVIDMQVIVNKWNEASTCPHCLQMHESPNAMNSHKGRCKKKPAEAA